MKSSAKAKSFHVAAQGNFPAARDLAKPNTYTTPRQGQRRKKRSSESSSKLSSLSSSKPSSESSSKPSSESSSKRSSTSSAESSPESAKHHRNDQSESSIINRPPTGHPDIESTTIPASDPSSKASPWNRERSVKRVVATEPQTICQVSRRHRTAKEPPLRYSQAIRPPRGLRRRTAYVAYTASNDERDGG